jgi:hypothetical protein
LRSRAAVLVLELGRGIAGVVLCSSSAAASPACVAGVVLVLELGRGIAGVVPVLEPAAPVSDQRGFSNEATSSSSIVANSAGIPCPGMPRAFTAIDVSGGSS